MTILCGDAMEIYPVIEKDIITDAKCFTDVSTLYQAIVDYMLQE